KAGGAGSDAADLVAQLRDEQITFDQFTSEMTSGLRDFRVTLESFLYEASATSVVSAFARRVAEALEVWKPAAVARRVLELSGVELTPPASRGVATFARRAGSVSSQ